MITELSLSNFKSWKHIDKMRFAPITGLFGTNSSGKTSLLQLLLMLKQTVESADRLQVLDFGNDKSPANLGGFRDIIYSHNEGAMLEWQIAWKLAHPLAFDAIGRNNSCHFEGSDIGFKAEIVAGANRPPNVNSMSYEFDNRRFCMRRKPNGKDKYELIAEAPDFQFVRNQGRVWDLPAPVKCYGFPNEVNARYQNAAFLSDLQLKFEQLFNSTRYLGPLREYPKRQYPWSGSEPADMGQRGERVVEAILAARQRGLSLSRGRGRRKETLEKRVATWLKELGLIESFIVEPLEKDGGNIYRVKVCKQAGSPNVLITDVGFGVSQILPAIVLCYYAEEGSIIILEQPEIHLHPSVQAGLADVFIDAVNTRNIQIIFESHSEHLLRRLQRRVAEKAASPGMMALYFCETKGGTSALTPLNVNLFGDIINWPKDFFGDQVGEIAAMTLAAIDRDKD